MRSVTRTVYGAYIQTNLLLGLPPVYHAFTTLNEKLNILPNDVPNSNQIPKLKYFTIGIGGHKITLGANGKPLIKPDPHDTVDAGLFEQIPFVLCVPGQDLPSTERIKYCLRKTINDPQGNPFIAYYGRKLDLTGANVTWEWRKIDDNGQIVDSQPFVPDSSNLNPVPNPLSNTGVATISSENIVVTCQIKIQFSKAQVSELLNVCNILYGDPAYGLISEIGYVTGVDKNITATSPGQGSFNFQEVIGAQIMSHMSVNYPLLHNNNGFEVIAEVGAQEPLLKFVTVNP